MGQDNSSCDSVLLWTKLSRAALAEPIRKQQMCLSAAWMAAGINPITQPERLLCAYFQHSHIMKHFRNLVYWEPSFCVSEVITPKALTSCCCTIDTNHELVVLIVLYCPMYSLRKFIVSSSLMLLLEVLPAHVLLYWRLLSISSKQCKETSRLDDVSKRSVPHCYLALSKNPFAKGCHKEFGDNVLCSVLLCQVARLIQNSLLFLTDTKMG